MVDVLSLLRAHCCTLSEVVIRIHVLIPFIPCRYPLYFALAVYQTPLGSVTALAYVRSNLSLSLSFTTISERKGEISSAFHFERVRKRSEKRAAGSEGSSEEGKYVRTGTGGMERGEGKER